MCTCLLDEDAKASLRISQAIDRELSQHKKETAREFKLLLLGRFIRVHCTYRYISSCTCTCTLTRPLGGAYKNCCGPLADEVVPQQMEEVLQKSSLECFQVLKKYTNMVFGITVSDLR